MATCETCGAETLLLVNVGLTGSGPAYTYRCPQGHITTTDFRTPPQDEGHANVAAAPATSPPPPPFHDGEVAGSPPES